MAKLNLLGMMYRETRQYEKARDVLEQVVNHFKERAGPDDPNTLIATMNLASTYRGLNEFERAASLYRPAVAELTRKLGPRNRITLVGMNNFALTLELMQRYEEAISLFESVVKGFEGTIGGDRPETLKALTHLAVCNLEHGRTDVGGRLCEETLTKARRVLGPNDPDTHRLILAMGRVHMSRREYGKAETLLREFFAAIKKHDASAHDSPTLYANAAAESILGEALYHQQRYAQAEDCLLRGYETMMNNSTGLHFRYTGQNHLAVQRLVQLYTAWDKPAKAAEWRKKLPPRPPEPND